MIEFYKNKMAELDAVKKLNAEIDNYKLAIKQLGGE
jgi:hypothetical protein